MYNKIYLITTSEEQINISNLTTKNPYTQELRSECIYER